MEPKLEKKYGLFTAICMVVGIVIGSGVFFKAQTILQKTSGNMPLGILAWLIGGAIMLVCILAFAAMAQKYQKINGIVDYAEATVGNRYAYYMGWFLTTIYYPTLTAVLAWLSARYTLVFITSCWPEFPLTIPAAEGGCATGPECMILTLFYLCAAYGVNAISPRLAGKLQTTTTVIKLIPLLCMAVAGVIVGLRSGLLVENFTNTVDVQALNATLSPANQITVSPLPLLSAVCSCAYAYEGWIIATTINAELKDAKRNLPRALIIGGIVIIVCYIAYYIGVSGGASNVELMLNGATTAFTGVFGGVLGNLLNLFVAISCLGTTNGLMLGCCRGLYSLSARRQGPSPHIYGQIDSQTNVPNNSAVFGLLVCSGWVLYFYFASIAQTWQGPFRFDASELPVITLYAMYLPIFVMWIKKAKDQNFLRRFFIPALAILGSCFMIYASIAGHGMENLWYLAVFAVIMLLGAWKYQSKSTLKK